MTILTLEVVPHEHAVAIGPDFETEVAAVADELSVYDSGVPVIEVAPPGPDRPVYSRPAAFNAAGVLDITSSQIYDWPVLFNADGALQPSGFSSYSQPVSFAGSGALSATVTEKPHPVMSGLTVWLDASTIAGSDGASIGSQWDDLSGGGHHGIVVGSPAPVVRTNALNGERIVQFTGFQGRVRGDGMVPNTASEVTVIYVGRMRAGSSLGRIFTNITPPYQFIVGTFGSDRNGCYDNGMVYPGTSWGAAPPPTPWTIWGATYQTAGNLTSFYVNGTLMGTGTASNGHDPRWALSGYAAATAEESCDCDVAELLTWNRALTSTERIQVENYLKDKWGL